MPQINLGKDHEPVDPEERKKFHSLVAKLVTMPDGQKRIIALEYWYWYCLDYMAMDWETDLDYILEFVTRKFGEDEDFEEYLPQHIRLSVSLFISTILAEKDGLANVEWYRLAEPDN